MVFKYLRLSIGRVILILVLLWGMPGTATIQPVHAMKGKVISGTQAADGDLDTTFGTNGIVTTDFNNNQDIGRSVALQPDGRIVVGGEAINNGNTDFALSRYMPDGSLDPTFDGDGKVTTDFAGGSDHGEAVAIQADGKIVLAGYSLNLSNHLVFVLARYNGNGSLDTTFDTDGKVITPIEQDATGYDVALQPDGKIVIVGNVLRNNIRDFALVRYNTNGSLDTGFGVNGIVMTDFGNADSGNAVVIQPSDGKIIVAGDSSAGDNGYFALARYNINGSLDATFDSDGRVLTSVGTSTFAGDLALQPDGKILAAGSGDINNAGRDFVLVRYNPDGSLDTTFDSDGKVITDVSSVEDISNAVVVQPDGRILMTGAVKSRTATGLVRYLSNGSLDPTFGVNGKVITEPGFDFVGFGMVLQPDQKIVIAGGGATYPSVADFAVARYIGLATPLVRYVKSDAGGANNGTSWADAYTNLQSALAAASSGDEIWVAAGTYTPGLKRLDTFRLRNGVAVYGGFAGTETDRQQRDPAVHLTTLSGDLNGDDVGFTNNAENSYHVVTGAIGATLDGFTIKGGNADFEIVDGAGVYNPGGSLTLANVTLINNSAYRNGGGIYDDSSTLTLTNVSFIDNVAGSGGGLYHRYGKSLTIRTVTFSGNTATYDGGGLYDYGSNLTLADVTFSGNSANGGGGLYNDSGTLGLTDVTFSSNTAVYGGGMQTRNSSPVLTDTTFSGNTVTYDGGGIYTYNGSPSLTRVVFSNNAAGNVLAHAGGNGGGMLNISGSPVLREVSFIGNSAGDGGGMKNYNSSNASLMNVTFHNNLAGTGGGMENSVNSNASLTNVTFSGNQSLVNGGGMSNDSSSPILTHVTFSGNFASTLSSTNRGGGMFNISSNPVIRNTIFWDNTAPAGDEQIYNYISPYSSSIPMISDSIIQDGCPSPSTCSNLLTTDPLLGTLGDYGGSTQTIPLLPGSAAIDAGNNANCPATDQRGVARPQGSKCDLGAYEAVPDLDAPVVIDVTSSAPNGSYAAGAMIPITVTFSEPVIVTGTPQLTLETGSVDEVASYTSGSGTNTLTFSYTVQGGDSSSDLEYVSSSALGLNGGTIKDLWGNNAVRTLPAPKAAHSLSSNKNIAVDGMLPVLQTFTRFDPTTTPTSADILVFRAAFSEAVSQVNSADFAVNGTTTASVTSVAAINPGTYEVTVSGGNLAGFNGVVGLDLKAGQNIQDLAGNPLPTTEPNLDETYRVDNSQLNIEVRIGEALQGIYPVPVPGSERKSYVGVDNGPVKINSQSDDMFIASERINLRSYDPLESYAEVMGLPTSKLSDTYTFPWYNNTGFLDSQLRFGNVGNAATTVTIKIGGQTRPETFTLAPNESARASFAGVDNGPVEVKSSGGVPIIAALRINLKAGSPFTSYAEFLGLSASSTPATRYVFPWYNNTGLLDSQLRFGNVGGASTTVTVRIGGATQPQTFTLAPNQSTRISYALDSGPVEVSSSGSVPITAAMRINLKNNAAFTSYTELMGLTGATLTDTRYLFPWYNNTGSLDSQLRFANVGDATTTVSIKINGVVQPQTYTLRASESVRVSLAGVDNGPVEVYSSGEPIIAALRINLKASPSYDSYYEFMGMSVGSPLGLPTNQLSSTYWFPWYNNSGFLDSQLRFGAP